MADTPRPTQARGDDDVPDLCRFNGITIRLFHCDHAPPHFHAEYGNVEAVVNIDTLEIVSGGLPSRALALMIEWAVRNRAQLLDWCSYHADRADRQCQRSVHVVSAAILTMTKWQKNAAYGQEEGLARSIWV